MEEGAVARPHAFSLHAWEEEEEEEEEEEGLVDADVSRVDAFESDVSVGDEGVGGWREREMDGGEEEEEETEEDNEIDNDEDDEEDEEEEEEEEEEEKMEAASEEGGRRSPFWSLLFPPSASSSPPSAIRPVAAPQQHATPRPESPAPFASRPQLAHAPSPFRREHANRSPFRPAGRGRGRMLPRAGIPPSPPRSPAPRQAAAYRVAAGFASPMAKVSIVSRHSEQQEARMRQARFRAIRRVKAADASMDVDDRAAGLGPDSDGNDGDDESADGGGAAVAGAAAGAVAAAAAAAAAAAVAVGVANTPSEVRPVNPVAHRLLRKQTENIRNAMSKRPRPAMFDAPSASGRPRPVVIPRGNEGAYEPELHSPVHVVPPPAQRVRISPASDALSRASAFEPRYSSPHRKPGGQARGGAVRNLSVVVGGSAGGSGNEASAAAAAAQGGGGTPDGGRQSPGRSPRSAGSLSPAAAAAAAAASARKMAPVLVFGMPSGRGSPGTGDDSGGGGGGGGSSSGLQRHVRSRSSPSPVPPPGMVVSSPKRTHEQMRRGDERPSFSKPRSADSSPGGSLCASPLPMMPPPLFGRGIMQQMAPGGQQRSSGVSPIASGFHARLSLREEHHTPPVDGSWIPVQGGVGVGAEDEDDSRGGGDDPASKRVRNAGVAVAAPAAASPLQPPPAPPQS